MLSGHARAFVCSYCRFSIARQPDGGWSALGKVADLVPTDPPLSVGDRGTLHGTPFVVVGRQQLDHGAGPWDEFFVELERGGSGWLALAQGRWFATVEQDPASVPAIASLGLGQPIRGGLLAGFTPFEIGSYRVLSAEGELPTPITVGDTGRHVDLEADGNRFATIDEGDGERRVYVGSRAEASAVVLTHRAARPGASAPEAARLRCGHCGSPIELASPATVHLGCLSCGSLVTRGGEVVDAVLDDRRARARVGLPLGVEGMLRGTKMRILGHLGKSCVVEGQRYGWDEYCLATETGFAWLVEENGHFTVYFDAPRIRIHDQAVGLEVDGRRMHLFSDVHAQVDSVLGEMPWQVRLGETVRAREFIAPPHSFSIESSSGEISCSRGTYLTADEVHAAFPSKLPRRPQRGVGTTQPAPAIGATMAIGVGLFALLFVGQCGLAMVGSDARLAEGAVTYPTWSRGASAVGELPTVTLFEDFVVPTTTVLDVSIDTQGLRNAWAESEVALVNRDTGELYELSLTTEAYSGVTDGEAWSEGNTSVSGSLSHVPPGHYFLRAESAWDTWPSTPATLGELPIASTIRVDQSSSPSGCCCLLTSFFLFVPMALAGWRRQSFVARRWSESNVSETGRV